jgi:capsular polysaccharide transport system permease protein
MASAAELAPPPVLSDRRLLTRFAILRRGLASQAEVVIALILRETRTRFGRNRLGYLWALIEPIVITFTFYGLLKVVGRVPPSNMDLFAFIATGVLPYTLFINTVTRVAEAVNGNKALLYYPQVRPIELVLARVALEASTFIAVFILIMGADALVAQRLELEDPLLVIAGMAAASALGAGFGLVFCVLGQVSTLADRVRGPLLRPLFWISGIFFTAASLPDAARDAALWNPVLHVTEMVRAGWFPGHDANYVDLGYVLWWIGGLALAGLALERWIRRRIDLT